MALLGRRTMSAMYDDSNMTLATAVLVVGLLIGAGVGYYMAPEGEPVYNSYDDMDKALDEPSGEVPTFDLFYWVPHLMCGVTSIWVWTLSDRFEKLKARVRAIERNYR